MKKAKARTLSLDGPLIKGSGNATLVVVLIVVSLLALVIGAIVVYGRALDKESRAYADAAISSIVSNWDVKQLERRASREFTSSIQPGDLDKIFDALRKLGALKEYKGSEGQATISITTQNGKVITATYLGDADFERGSARIQIVLIQHDDQWQVLGFRVNSSALGQ
jgi:hypothetical protein